MKKTSLLIAALLVVPVVHADQNGNTRYVTDQITFGLHEQPSNGAATVGFVKSGDPVTVLKTLGDNSFTQVKTADGTTGWIIARDLSDQPPASTQLGSVKKQLSAAQAQIKTQQAKLDEDQQQLAKVKPALDLEAENHKLSADIAQREQQLKTMEQRYDIETAHRDTLITGAALACGGIIFGLLLPWLGKGRKKRYSDF